MKLEGTLTAVATPLTPDASAVDYASFERLLEYQFAGGVQGIVCCGSTGEAQTLSEKEYVEVISFCAARTKGRLPLVAGLSVSSTQRGVELAQKAAAAGAQALLVSAPPYNKPPQDGIFEHVSRIGRASGLPIVAYNIPGRSGVNILPPTLARLAAEGLITAVKESSGSMDQMQDLLVAAPDSLAILAGDDSFVTPLMACGGRGVICTCSNVAPREFVAMTAAALRNDFREAGRLQRQLTALIRCMFIETNPIPIKTALWIKEIISSPAVRLPLVPAKPDTVKRIRTVLEEL